MSKFNEEYVQFLKDHDEDFKSSGQEGFTTVLNAYLDWIEGNVSCACDYGCNQAIAENGAKLAALIRASHLGMSDMFMETLALKDPVALIYDLSEKMWNRAKAKRAPKI